MCRDLVELGTLLRPWLIHCWSGVSDQGPLSSVTATMAGGFSGSRRAWSSRRLSVIGIILARLS
ncbi:hypothetical protein D3C86_1785760 [compost metagenome]